MNEFGSQQLREKIQLIGDASQRILPARALDAIMAAVKEHVDWVVGKNEPEKRDTGGFPSGVNDIAPITRNILKAEQRKRAKL